LCGHAGRRWRRLELRIGWELDGIVRVDHDRRIDHGARIHDSARVRDVDVVRGGRGLRERRFLGGRILVHDGLGRLRADPAAGNRHAERIRGV